MTEQELAEFVERRTKEVWDADQRPYLLSLVATELREEGKDYRSALADERLKSFSKRVAEERNFKVLEHPTQRAKVGLIPADAEYAFSDENDLSDRFESVKPRSDRAGGDDAVIAFLRAMARLPDAMLDEVVIPTKVLTRLITRR